VGLRGEVVNLVRPYLGQDGGQRLGVAEVAVMQPDVPFAQRRLAEVIDPTAVEGRGTAHHPVNLIILVEQELRKVRTILAGDAGNQRLFHGRRIPEEEEVESSELRVESFPGA